MINQKKLQWIFALISTLFLIRVLYYSDPNFLVFEENKLFIQIIQYIIVLPSLLWMVIISNKWLYNVFVKEGNLRVIITYDVFQKIFTVYQFILMTVIIYGNLKWVDGFYSH